MAFFLLMSEHSGDMLPVPEMLCLHYSRSRSDLQEAFSKKTKNTDPQTDVSYVLE